MSIFAFLGGRFYDMIIAASAKAAINSVKGRLMVKKGELWRLEWLFSP